MSTLLTGARKKRVFFSFIEEDRERVNGLRLLAANPNYDLEFYDESVRVAIDSRDADYVRRRIREKIGRASVTVCLISKNTHTSSWVDWAGGRCPGGRRPGGPQLRRGGPHRNPLWSSWPPLRQLPWVEEAAVVPEPEIGNRIRAMVVLAPGHAPSPERAEALRAELRTRLAPFKVPQVIEFAEALPKSPVGKVLRREVARRRID